MAWIKRNAFETLLPFGIRQHEKDAPDCLCKPFIPVVCLSAAPPWIQQGQFSAPTRWILICTLFLQPHWHLFILPANLYLLYKTSNFLFLCPKKFRVASHLFRFSLVSMTENEFYESYKFSHNTNFWVFTRTFTGCFSPWNFITVVTQIDVKPIWAFEFFI
jgi:hypothetical protein